MKTSAIIYVPSDTPEAMFISTAKVAGVPMIVRGLMSLNQAGMGPVTLLLADSQRERVEKFLGRYKEARLPEFNIVTYDEPYRVSPDIVSAIADGMDLRCLLINANLLFDKDLIELIRNQPLDAGGIITCRYGETPLQIIDVTPESWKSLLSFTVERPRSIQSCIKLISATARNTVVQKPVSINTFLLKRIRDRAVAEKFLTEAIRHQTPGPIAKHINKRISLPISLLLSKLWVSPNAVTGFNIIIGLFSGVFVADGNHYQIILFGTVLFQIASIVDGCDGEVAKLTFRCSKFGQYIDSLSDNLSLGSFMTGLIAGYWRHTHSAVAFYVGSVMIVCTAITLFWMILYLKKNTESASLVTFDKEYLQKLSGEPGYLLTFIKYGKIFLKKDVFSFAFLVFAILGVLYWWLFIAAFGTTVSAAILTYLNLRPRTSRPGVLAI